MASRGRLAAPSAAVGPWRRFRLTPSPEREAMGLRAALGSPTRPVLHWQSSRRDRGAGTREWGMCGLRVLFSLSRRFGLVAGALDLSSEAARPRLWELLALASLGDSVSASLKA